MNHLSKLNTIALRGKNAQSVKNRLMSTTSNNNKSSSSSSSSSVPPAQPWQQLADPKVLGVAAAGLATLLFLGSGSSSSSPKSATNDHAAPAVPAKAAPSAAEKEELKSAISVLKEEIAKAKEAADAAMTKEQELLTKLKTNGDNHLEDMKQILSRLHKLEHQVIQDEATRLNRAFVFLKPHAVNDKVDALLKEKLKKAGVVITSDGVIPAKTIDEKQLIDTHYYAIASKAVLISPKDLTLTPKAKEEFLKISNGLTWEEALSKGYVYSAKEACEKLGVDGDQLEKLWAPVKAKKALVKFGGGFYCGRMVDEDKEKGVAPMFVINGFYMAMRGKYTNEPASIHYYTVEWDPRVMSWKDFRTKLLGSTDPAEAAEGSIRREIYNTWESLGLAAIPDTGMFLILLLLLLLLNLSVLVHKINIYVCR